jgi:hypothetical protein
MQATGTVRTFGRGSVQVVVVAAVAVAGIAIGRWGIPAEDAATVVTGSRSDVISASDRFENMAERKLAQIDATDSGYAATVDGSVAAVVVDAANVSPIPASAVERKLAQTGASSEFLSDAANVSPIPASAVERKLAQTGTSSEFLSDTANAAPIPASAVERKLAQTSVQSPALSDAANVAPIPDSAVERKLAQASVQSPALSDAANVAPIPDSAIERKLAQTGPRGFTRTTISTNGFADLHAHHDHANVAPIPAGPVTSGGGYKGMFETKFAQEDARDAR